jgi:lipopolysaccharide/colanic/teichoic acid biosynthesis glycosyltransferase
VKPEGGFETPEFAMAKETGDLMVRQYLQRCFNCSIDVAIIVLFMVLISLLAIMIILQ